MRTRKGGGRTAMAADLTANQVFVGSIPSFLIVYN